MLLAYSPDKRHYAYDGPKISCTETYARCYINNESERMLRKVAIHRKIRQKLVTVGGKIMFGTIIIYLFTWNKLDLNWFEKLSKAF